MLKQLTGEDDVLEQGKVAGADWEYADSLPVNELKTPGFFAMAFPTVFVNGSCDITYQKLVNINYDEWVEHIYYCRDNRALNHPYLKFFLHNLGLRMKALNQGSFLVS